jgi:hypothetical protein
VELATDRGANAPGGLNMAAPSYVFTIARVAEMLGEDEEWLHEIADDMEPEDGCLWVCDINNNTTRAFTQFGIDSLKELMHDYRKDNTGA